MAVLAFQSFVDTALKVTEVPVYRFLAIMVTQATAVLAFQFLAATVTRVTEAHAFLSAPAAQPVAAVAREPQAVREVLAAQTLSREYRHMHKLRRRLRVETPTQNHRSLSRQHLSRPLARFLS